jgi:ribosome-associated protein
MASEETRRQLLVAVAACDDKKGEDTRILELDPADSGLADFFLITSATNDRQVVAIADEIEFRLKKDFGLYATSVEGRKQGEWILLDYVDLVIHVFLAEKRAFYDIERLRKSARNLTSADVEAELTSALKKKTIAVRKGAPAAKKSVKKAAKKAVKKAAKKAAGKSPTTKAVALKTPKGGAALAKKAAKKAVVKTAAKKAVVKKAVAKKAAVKAPAVKKAALKKAAVPAKKAAIKKAVAVKAVPVAKKAALKKAAVKTAASTTPAVAPKVLGVMAPNPIPKGMLGAKPPILKCEDPGLPPELSQGLPPCDPPATPAVALAASAAPKKAAKKSKS